MLPFNGRQSECLLIMCLGNKRSKIEVDSREKRFALFKYKVKIYAFHSVTIYLSVYLNCL